ncbi:TNF receptor-associated factor 3 [Lingula anatina]|uniref:TNF receptor-associated factor 3 n=1 Tax=Lingula anatina TaxID=7574 RepID=A0A1S3HWN2_LINAN|nr:TNF receptor-associated factor 3 [Lingula anatina]|eukprot:XP_013389961.1 TNF receptor-associated factor 3 [Lingula anatina]
MDERKNLMYKETLKKNRVDLVEELKSEHLISYLLQERVVTPRDHADFKALQTRREGSEWLIDHLTAHGPPHFYDVLRRALIKEGQEHVADKLDATLTELMEEDKTARPSKGHKRRRSQSSGSCPSPKYKASYKNLNRSSPTSSVSSSSPRGSPTLKQLQGVNSVLCKYHDKGCCQSVPPEELETHYANNCAYRPQQCPHCENEVPLIAFGQHVSTCKVRKTGCPVCSETVAQGQLDEHIEKHYDTQDSKCHFVLVGCTYAGKSADLGAHRKEAVCSHLDLHSKCCEKKHKETKTSLFSIRTDLDSVKSTVDSLQKQNSVTKGILDEMRNTSYSVNNNTSPAVSSAFHPFPTPESQHEIETTGTPAASKKPVAGKKTQLFKPALKNVLTLSNMTGNVVVGKNITFGEKDKVMQDEILIDNTGEEECFQWDVYPVTNYLGAVRKNLVESIISPVFYTNNKSGYKMQLQMYLNGDGEESRGFVSLFFVLLPVINDGKLDWPFKQNVTIKILDQSEQKRHIVYELQYDPDTEIENPIPTEDSFVAYGVPKFVRYEFLEKKQYLYISHDRIRVEVQVSD